MGALTPRCHVVGPARRCHQQGYVTFSMTVARTLQRTLCLVLSFSLYQACRPVAYRLPHVTTESSEDRMRMRKHIRTRTTPHTYTISRTRACTHKRTHTRLLSHTHTTIHTQKQTKTCTHSPMRTQTHLSRYINHSPSRTLYSLLLCTHMQTHATCADRFQKVYSLFSPPFSPASRPSPRDPGLIEKLK